VPPWPDSDHLKAVMQSPCHRMTDNHPSFPKFEPHITIASFPVEIPLSRIREAIPTNQGQLKLSFASVEIGTHYFRSVYIAVKPSPGLAALHERIHAVLGVDRNTPAFPHISLCYVTDEDAQKGLRQEFFEGLGVRKDGDGVCLNYGDDQNESWINGFIANEIWIMRCEGPVEGWAVLDVIKLQEPYSQL